MSEQGVTASRLLADRYAEVVAQLTPSDWERPSRCAGWRVQDLVAHTSSNFLLLVEPPPPADPVPGLTAERAQDMLVDARRSWTSTEVREEFEAYRKPAVDVLAAVQEEPTASTPMTMMELGTYPTGALADAFAFDLYCHLRVDLLGSLDPAPELPPVTDEELAPGISWMLAGLPQMCPAVSDVLEAPLGLRLTGPGGGEWTLEPGSPLVVSPGLTAPTAVATCTATDFVVWGTARAPWREHVTLEGDEAYGARVLDAIDIV